MRNLTMAIMIAFAFANPLQAETRLDCPFPTAVDGNTILCLDNVRLAGIDAPEIFQQCRGANGALWPCGETASDALNELVFLRSIDCLSIDTDRYGRHVAICAIGDTDIGDMIVRAGWALNEPRHEPDYGEAEAAAREARIGIHEGEFVAPREWRAGARLD